MVLPATLDSPPMVEKKPSRRYIAKGVPTRSQRQWYGQYSFPGVVPLYVTDHGAPVLYQSEEEAAGAAALALVDALNNRQGMPGAAKVREHADGSISRRALAADEKFERYERLSGAEFSVLMAEAGITPTFFRFLYSTTPERLVEWMDALPGDERAPPHPARLLLEIFKRIPASIDIAEEITESATTARKGEGR